MREVSKEHIKTIDAFFERYASEPVSEVLVRGQPWGALEALMLEKKKKKKKSFIISPKMTTAAITEQQDDTENAPSLILKGVGDGIGDGRGTERARFRANHDNHDKHDSSASAGSGSSGDYKGSRDTHVLVPGVAFSLPTSADDPVSIMEVQPWLELIQNGTFSIDTLRYPPLSYQTTDEWQQVLTDSAAEFGMSWLHALHLGVCAAERGQVAFDLLDDSNSLALADP